MWMKRLVFCALAAWFLSSSVAAHDIASGDLVIGHPHTAPTRGAAGNAAVYLTITHNGSEADTLVAVRTNVAANAELHDNFKGDAGIVRMRPVEGLLIPPGELTVLSPGGAHIMLIGLTAPLAEEEVFPMTLTFARAGDVLIDIYVTGEPEPEPEHDSHADH